MRFDLTDLRLFRHVVETESITRGAERTHLALASASARIRGMEEVLGVPLLKRGRRGVQPTDAGRALLDHARIVLQQIETMRGELGAYSRGLKGHVRLLANTAAMSEHLPALLADFLAANPTIDLDLEDRESPAIAAAIAAGDADIGIATEASLVPGLESHPFRPDRLVLAVASGHRLAGKRQVGFAELLDLDFVGLTRGTALDEHVARHAARLGRALRLQGQSQQSRCRMRHGGGRGRRRHRAGGDGPPSAARPAARHGAHRRALGSTPAHPLRPQLLSLSRPARQLFDALQKSV